MRLALATRGLAALALVAALAVPVRAQDSSFFPGRRVWVSYEGSLVPTGKIVGQNPDGSYRVQVYRHEASPDPSVTQPEEALLRGEPIATFDVPAADVAEWNRVRFTAWVTRKGAPWPKAEVVSDTGSEVTVRVWDESGSNVEETRTISDPKELLAYRKLNAATKPGPEVTAEVDSATKEAIDRLNAELEQNGWKLPDGEPYPRILTVAELTEAVRGIAVRWAPGIAAETDPSKRAQLQDDMMREVYVAFERLEPIKHSGRETTTDAWKEAGRRFADSLPATASELQRALVKRFMTCFSKSEVVWKIMNLAELPELVGVGFRRLDGAIHGILGLQYADGSRRTWETTEGFEPHGTRAFKPWEVQFHGTGPGGRGLDYMKSVKPIADPVADVGVSPELLARIQARDAAVKNAGAQSPERGIADVLKDRTAPEDKTAARDGR